MNPHPRPFTPEDDDTIRRMCAAGIDDTVIGEALGRTRYAIESRRYRIKVKRPANRGAKVEGAEEAEIKRLAEAGLTVTEIGLAVNRTRAAVRRALMRVNLTAHTEPDKQTVTWIEHEERPLGVPFETSSGLVAIRLASGVVPFVPSLYGSPSHLPPASPG